MARKTTDSALKRREQTLQEVRRMTRTVLGRYPVKVYLFGSWAKGTPSRYSDIDVGIEPTAPLPPGVLATLRERFEESHVPYRVEVVDLSTADPTFREAVVRQGIPWND
ncbi:MAG: nucleotidyltransferase domain-containing protein [Candidatus Omnitrophica bacterium]|nr:nucleotidyltransferase domain-containing protein [Candidatus Omnitrophota bacterium]